MAKGTPPRSRRRRDLLPRQSWRRGGGTWPRWPIRSSDPRYSGRAGASSSASRRCWSTRSSIPCGTGSSSSAPSRGPRIRAERALLRLRLLRLRLLHPHLLHHPADLGGLDEQRAVALHLGCHPGDADGLREQRDEHLLEVGLAIAPGMVLLGKEDIEVVVPVHEADGLSVGDALAPARDMSRAALAKLHVARHVDHLAGHRHHLAAGQHL